jgi:RsiW-degrading membrane proteinase PrsW (M82 family)
MYERVTPEFINRARLGILRGMAVAAIFVITQYVPILSDYIRKDWVLFPVIFFMVSLPFSWQRIGSFTLVPLILSLIAWFSLSFFETTFTDFLWSPFHEEIGKWYQSVTLSYPAVMSPFVSL